MKIETRGNVTVEVTNEFNGVKLERWIIKRISGRGLPDIKFMENSFDTAEEAIAHGFELAAQMI